MTSTELRAEIERLKDQRSELRTMLCVMLDCIDYTNGACSDMHVVGAVINDATLERARRTVEQSRI